jgi:signal peptidase I
LNEASGPLLERHRRWEGASIALGIVGAALVALTLKGTVFGAYRVLSASMLPTLKPGDHVAVNKLSYGLRSAFGEERASQRAPRRGDLVVFSRDDGDGVQEQVKRVIGLPGDHIRMDGLVPVVNGWPVPTCSAGQYTYVSAGAFATGRVQVEFLEDRAYLILYGPFAPELEREYVVGPREVFVIGDNRSDSMDSRTYNSGFGGGVDVATLEGRVDWFLTGRKNNGDLDLGRLLSHPGIDLGLEGVDASDLERRIQACLGRRPRSTTPPPAPDAPKGGT